MKFVFFLSTALLLQSCTIFEKDEKLLGEHKKENGDRVRIYYVGLGATTNDVIQVRKIVANQAELIIKVFENYDYLESSALINDTSLQLVINDTGYYKHKPDTVIINVK